MPCAIARCQDNGAAIPTPLCSRQLPPLFGYPHPRLSTASKIGATMDGQQYQINQIIEYSSRTCVSKRPKVSGRKLAARVEPQESSKIQCVIHLSGQIP